MTRLRGADAYGSPQKARWREDFRSGPGQTIAGLVSPVCQGLWGEGWLAAGLGEEAGHVFGGED